MGLMRVVLVVGIKEDMRAPSLYSSPMASRSRIRNFGVVGWGWGLRLGLGLGLRFEVGVGVGVEI